MFTETENNYVFTVSDKTLSNIGKVMSGVLVGALTFNYFGIVDVGSSNDVTLQIGNVPVSAITRAAGSDHQKVNAAGISRESYSSHKKLSNNIEKGTFTITAKADANGIEEELLDESEFKADGTRLWVACDTLNVREHPNAEAEKVGEIGYGNSVIRISYGNSWSKIKLDDGTAGYVLSILLSDEEIVPTPVPERMPTPTPEVQKSSVNAKLPENNVAEAVPETTTQQTEAVSYTPSYTETELYKTSYAVGAVNLRSAPSTDADLVRVLNDGSEITVIAQTDTGWYKTAKGNYVKASLTTDTPPAVPETSSQESAPVVNDFASYCLQYVGCSYVYCGSSPSTGFDCSGFVSYVYANYYGISLPHSADSIYQMGYAVSAEEMIAGDVVCNDHNGDGYIDHVSVYIGDGRVVHASTSTTGVITSNFSELKDVVSIRRLR